MKSSLVTSITLTASLLLCSGFALAAGATPSASAAASRTAAASGPAATASQGRAGATVVDINSASKAELTKLPGLTALDAERVIAGRPYLSKAHLVTRNVISASAYHGIKSMIMARQKGVRRPGS